MDPVVTDQRRASQSTSSHFEELRRVRDQINVLIGCPYKHVDEHEGAANNAAVADEGHKDWPQYSSHNHPLPDRRRQLGNTLQMDEGRE